MSYMAYLTVSGEKQGGISNGCNSKTSMGGKYQLSHADEISVIAYEHHLSMNGRKSGKSNSPLFITKFIDTSTPLLAMSLSSREILNCKLKFYRTNDGGFNENFLIIELKNAIISSLSSNMPNIVAKSLDVPINEMYEVVGFSYQEITWLHNLTGASGYDAWNKKD